MHRLHASLEMPRSPPALARHPSSWGRILTLIIRWHITSPGFIFSFFSSHIAFLTPLLLFHFQYLLELVSKEMRVSDRTARVSSLELWTQMEDKYTEFQDSFHSRLNNEHKHAAKHEEWPA